MAQHNEAVTVAVADTGPGIAAHELSTLFEKYRRAAATRHREGMGLGLFIVKVLERWVARSEPTPQAAA